MSWENYIAQVSSDEVRNEVDITGDLSVNENKVRNLARSVGSEEQIKMKDMSFGLQLPLVKSSSLAGNPYDENEKLNISSVIYTNNPNVTNRTAELIITLLNDGAGSYFAKNQPSNITKDFTWLKIGSANQYEVKLEKHSGDDPTLGPSINTWLSLDTNRQWVWTAIAPDEGGQITQQFIGSLSIRRGDEIGPFRELNVSLDSTYENIGP